LDHIENYLITRSGGVRHQVDRHFEPVSESEASYIKSAAQKYYPQVPVYKTDTIEIR